VNTNFIATLFEAQSVYDVLPTPTNLATWGIFRLFVFSHTSNISAIWRLSPLPVTGLQI
jgi:hypothetical protein